MIIIYQPPIRIGDYMKIQEGSIHHAFKRSIRKGIVIHKKTGVHYTLDTGQYNETFLLNTNNKAGYTKIIPVKGEEINEIQNKLRSGYCVKKRNERKEYPGKRRKQIISWREF